MIEYEDLIVIANEIKAMLQKAADENKIFDCSRAKIALEFAKSEIRKSISDNED